MPRISVFKNISETQNPITWDLIQYLEDTRDGMWENIVLQCRSIRDPDERKEFKKTMPTTTLSGFFSQRGDKYLDKHSNILALDLDDLEKPDQARERLRNDKHVLSVFLSTSGNGLRVLFKIDGEKHREAFKAISQYVYENYGYVSDRNGINVSKPYIVSFDPLLWLNPDNVPVWKKYIKETVVKPLQDFVHTDEDFHNVLRQIVGRSLCITPDYNDWVRVGFALADKFGQDGRQYFHQISEQYHKYKPNSCDTQYDYCLKAHGTEKVGISTFYYFAKTCGINITSERTKKIVRTTTNSKRAGLKKEQIIANLKKFENITDVDNLVNDIFDNGTDINDEEESIVSLLEIFIANNYSLRQNEITGYIENHGIILKENDINSVFIAAKKIIPKLDFQLMIRLLKSHFVEVYNPFFEFLGSDGIAVHLPAIPVDNSNRFQSPLIDTLSLCIKNDNPSYTNFFTRKWLVSIISAMHKVHSPLLHTLLGSQNTGKTEFYRRLLPKELKYYYAESKLDKGKDDELLMCENIIIMDDELSGKSKSDTIKLNGVTSSDWFSLRRPYGSQNEKVLRYAVLCGTSNYPNSVLSDPTGNRRIIPIDVDDIDKELYNSIDKKELFHEAFRLYKEGFDWRVTQKDIPFLNHDAEKYEVVIKERELIEKYYLNDDRQRMSTTEILVDLEIMTKQKLSINTIGRELKSLGFELKSTRTNAVQCTRKWAVTKLYDMGNDNMIKIDNSEEVPF